MVLVAAVALGSSTYAWFVTNTKVTAGKATMTATAASTLLISASGQNEWATSYDFTETNTTFAPVSTVGTNDETDFTFFKQKNWAKDAGQNNAITVDKVSELTDAEKADGATPLYYKKSFDIKASQACKLYLDTETAFTEAAGTMNKTLRLALVVKDSTGAHKKTVIYQVDKDSNDTAGNRYNTTLASTSSDGISKAVSAVGADDAVTADSIAVVVPITADIKGQGLLATADANNVLAPTVGSNVDILYEFTGANDV